MTMMTMMISMMTIMLNMMGWNIVRKWGRKTWSLQQWEMKVRQMALYIN